MHLVSNESLYLGYLGLLLAGAVVSELRHGAKRILGHAAARRSEAEMSVIHGEFIVITGINLGVGQITFQYMPEYLQQLAFLLVVIETLAWACLIYRDDWFSRKLIRLLGAGYRS
jgi:hypothetical protein